MLIPVFSFAANTTIGDGFFSKTAFRKKFSIFLFLVFSFFNLLQDRLDDLEKGIDGEAEEEAKVASDVRNEVIASVDLEVGVDLDVKGKLEEELIFEGLKHFWLWLWGSARNLGTS